MLMIFTPITISGIDGMHNVFTEIGVNASIHRQLITPPTTLSRARALRVSSCGAAPHYSTRLTLGALDVPSNVGGGRMIVAHWPHSRPALAAGATTVLRRLREHE